MRSARHGLFIGGSAAIPGETGQAQYVKQARYQSMPRQDRTTGVRQQLSGVCSIFSLRPHAGEAERSPGSVRHVPATCVCAPVRHLDIWRWGVGEHTASDTTSGTLARPEDVALFTGIPATGDNTANCSLIEQCPQHLINRAWSALLDPTDHADDRRTRGLAGAAMFLVLGIMAQVWSLPTQVLCTECVSTHAATQSLL